MFFRNLNPLKKLPLKNNLRQSGVSIMGDGQGYILDAESAGNFAADASESQRRFATALPHHFNIDPAHAASQAGSQSLHRRLLGGKASGEALGMMAMRFAIGNLRGREKAFQERAATPLDRRCDAVDFRDVNAQADDHQDSRPRVANGSRDVIIIPINYTDQGERVTINDSSVLA